MSICWFLIFFIISIPLNVLFVKAFNCYTLKKINYYDQSDNNKDNNRFIGLFNNMLNIANSTLNIVKSIFNIFNYGLNVDYAESRKSKKLIEDKLNKEKKSDNITKPEGIYESYIKNKNKNNLIISYCTSIFLIVGLGIRKCIYLINYIKIDGIFNFLCVFLFIRLISRTFEIIIAFYNDILDNEKKSDLKSNDRFKLAVNSLIEIVLRSAMIYLLIDTLKYECGQSLLSDIMSSIYLSINNTINFASAYSAETNTIGTYEFIRKTVIVLQGLTSFVLIILSFAQYLSSSQDKQDENIVIVEEIKNNKVNKNKKNKKL